MDGRGCDEAVLIEFLCARHPRRVRAAKAKWEGRNDASLVDRLSDELKGDMRKIALTLLKGRRATIEDDDDDEEANEARAKQQAAAIHGYLASGNTAKIIEVLCSQSSATNGAIARAYEDTYDESLGRAVEGLVKGHACDALKALIQPDAQWYAARLKAAFKGVGTSDRTVCRILGGHSKDEVPNP